MPELFSLRFDLGADAPVSTVATTMTDFETITEGALYVALLDARLGAQRHIADLVANEGLRALVNEARRREVRTPERLEGDLAYLEEIAEELDMFAREFGPPFLWRRWPKPARQAALLSGLLGPDWLSPWGGAPWDRVLGQLLAVETAERLPDQSYRIRSFRYSNPAAVELIAASGAASVALGYLLSVIATLGPRRRRESARADAEERIQAAHARDVEDLVGRRIQLRALLLDRIRGGELHLRPEDITEAFLDKIVGAADRLGERGLAFERQQLPTPGGQ